MGNSYRHVVFKTAWGYFGLCGADEGVRYSSLPVRDRDTALGLITARPADSRYDTGIFRQLQEHVKAYFEGVYVDFSDVALDLTDVSAFRRRALAACRRIEYGKTASYARLASLAGSPRAARAAGSVMAANPLPLIIPCHRIVRSDGSVGCFSAVGGTEMKRRLLAMEAQGVLAMK